MSSSQPVKEPLAVRITSGSVGSIITALVVTPLEVVKVRQQFQSSLASASSPVSVPKFVSPCPSCGVFVFNNGLKECILPRSAVPYFDPSTGLLKTPNPAVSNSTGTFSMLRNIWRTEGPRGVYAGLRPTLAMGIPNTVLYFTSYEELKERMDRFSSSGVISPASIPPLAGASARLVASCATAPLELIRTRQAAQIGGGGSAGGLVVELQNVVRNEGILSLYRGLSPTLMRDVPFSAVYWYCIEGFRTIWGDAPVSSMEQAAHALINGSVAGMIAAATTTPLDVIKTRNQLTLPVELIDSAVCDHQGAIVYQSRPGPTHPGSIATMKQILSEEGVSGLWRGNQARMIKVAPACGIMLSSYEIGKRILSDVP